MLLTLILNKLAFILTSYLNPVEFIASPHLLAVESQNGIIECSYFFLFSSTVNPEGFLSFSKEIYKVPRLISRIAHFV